MQGLRATFVVRVKESGAHQGLAQHAREKHMNARERTAEIYAAFARGDIEFILAQISDEVIWEYDAPASSVPWLQPRSGKAGAAAFFQTLAETMQILRFVPTRILGDGDLGIGITDIEFIVKATGKRVVERDEVHLWHFNEQGQVIRFRHRIDTLTQQRACE
jgi:uncharacterized protein